MPLDDSDPAPETDPEPEPEEQIVGPKAITGTTIGGWLVPQPWITPSLFYQFLGNNQTQGIATDSWSLCEVLGPEEGNKLMRAHWTSWFNETKMKALAGRGVNYVKLPIGDWTL